MSREEYVALQLIASGYFDIADGDWDTIEDLCLDYCRDVEGLSFGELIGEVFYHIPELK